MLTESLRKTLKAMSKSAYYIRGVAYYEQGLVTALEGDDEQISATVHGGRIYDVRFREEDGELIHDCTCPIGDEGDFCKHCVAVGLAWLAENGEQTGKQTKSRQKRRSTTDDIRDYLMTLESADLVELVLDACKRDDRLRARLLLKAGERGDDNAVIRTWKSALDRATAVRDFVDWREMSGFAGGIQEVIAALDGWLESGRAPLVVDMAEHAAAKVEGVIGTCDDSNGELGELLNHIAELHLAACKLARPDPEALAERLFKYELNGDWDTFRDIPNRYAAVLGKRGLAVYRRLAEAQWARVSQRQPDAERRASWDSERFRITSIMESLAQQSGDVEALVAVKSRDLSSAWNFLQIAEIYRDAKQRDKALAWAERGLAAFPKRTDARLREFLIEEYLRRKRSDEAIALAWAQFEEQPYLATYRKLNGVAKKLDVWPRWRDQALAFLRQKIARDFAQASKSRFGRLEGPDQSPLVDILLWEKDAESAWREAKAGSCRAELWLTLADLRAKDHPQDAIAVYRREVARLVEQTDNRAYEQAIALVKKIKPLSKAQDFTRYIAGLRVQFKAKRNFMKLLDKLSARPVAV